MSNEPDITMEKVKSRVLPLLKGNQLLIDWFLQLFDRETPPESGLNEYETIYLKKTIGDDSLDNIEEVVIEAGTASVSETSIGPNENTSSSNATSCGVKYINGKIIYRGRTILPAKISFLAYDSHTDESGTNCQIETGTNGNFCVHEIRKHIQRPVIEKAEVLELDVKKTKSELKKDKSTVKKKVVRGEVVSKYKLCDGPTLRAHAIRLNPVVHGRDGEKYSDIAHLLTQPSLATPNGSSEM